jgi:hypothetical protein
VNEADEKVSTIGVDPVVARWREREKRKSKSPRAEVWMLNARCLRVHGLPKEQAENTQPSFDDLQSESSSSRKDDGVARGEAREMETASGWKEGRKETFQVWFPAGWERMELDEGRKRAVCLREQE